MIVSHSLGRKKTDIEKISIDVLGTTVSSRLIEKTGPKFLRHLEDDESTLTIGLDALNKLLDKLQKNGIDISSVSNFISVTETPVRNFPGNSFDLISGTSLNENIFAIDINAGCTGFVDAVRLASSLGRRSIILCSEAYSKRIPKFDRSVSPLFSDAAAAVFYDTGSWRICGEAGGIRKSTSSVICAESSSGDLKMTGRDVAEFVSDIVIIEIEKLCQEFSPDIVLVHQGSKFVVDFLKSRLNIENAIFPENIIDIGNTVSASIPILYEQFINNSLLKKNSKILIAGFGVGLSYSIAVLEKIS